MAGQSDIEELVNSSLILDEPPVSSSLGEEYMEVTRKLAATYPHRIVAVVSARESSDGKTKAYLVPSFLECVEYQQFYNRLQQLHPKYNYPCVIGISDPDDEYNEQLGL